MRFGRSAVRLKRFRTAWAAALSAAALALSAASGFAAKAPDPQPLAALAPVGGQVTVDADWFFFNMGTNPRITDVEFSTTEYYSTHEIIEGVLHVQVKTAEELNALSSPPPGRFTVDATVTMANDEGRTATGTIEFQTVYQQDAPAPLPPDELPDPAFSVTQVRTLPPGVMRSAQAALSFSNAGTNPRITGAEFSTTEWYDVHEIRAGILYVQPKTAAELSALPAPPPSTFTVDVTVTMANDEGRTASGTITFRTTYDRVLQPKRRVTPTLSAPGTYLANPGFQNSFTADFLFDNAGTNPRITGAEFSTTEYYKDHSISRGRLWVQAMTAAQLNALPTPPPSPITVDVAVTMANDEGQTASGTITLETTYDRVEPPQSSAPPVPAPTFTGTAPINAHPGTQVEVWIRSEFDNPGTNPRFTDVTFSTTEYYSSHYIHTYAASEETGGPTLHVTAKTHAELNALPTPPPSPFTVTADVTMTNDEGQTATGTLTFQTSYITASGSNPTPVPANAVTRELPAGAGFIVKVLPIFPLGGTNPGLTSVEFSTTEYYSMHDYSSGRRHGPPQLYVTAKTSEQLNALPTPPPTPFTVTVDMTLTNDEGETVSGTMAFTTTYIRNETEEEAAPEPTFSVTGTKTVSPGFQINVSADEAFANAGTNPRITAAEFSTTEYYDIHRIADGGLWIGAKTAAALNALPTPPPSPFTVDVAVTMTNDEGQTASGTITVETTYERALTSTPAPGQTPTEGGPADPPQ